jgi:uncharacterized protein DUF998
VGPRDARSAAQEFAGWLRPPGWPLLAERDRRRVRILALFAIAAQLIFIAGWIVAGALEPGYSAQRQAISELGSATAAHPWILNFALGVWGFGFVCLGAAIAPGLRGRPWGRIAPALFMVGGAAAALAGPVRLDCAPNGDPLCAAREAAGDLSFTHYTHLWLSVVIVLALLATPFALARAEWPSRLARLTLAGGIGAAILWFASTVAIQGGHANDGFYQRVGLGVINYWVLLVAATLLLETNPRWTTAVAAVSDRLARGSSGGSSTPTSSPPVGS